MKRFFYLLIAICAVGFVGCSDDDENNGDEEGDSKSKIVMELFEDSLDFHLGTSKPGQSLKIDWGDGNVKEYKSDEELFNGVNIDGAEEYSYYPFKIEYNYINKAKYTITIEGENIVYLDCFDVFSSLDLTSNSLLYLKCHFNNLTTLDLTKCTALIVVDCSDDNLTSLDVSKCTALTKLLCGGNNLTSLDVSKCTGLIDLYCGGNSLTSLDLSKCTALTRFFCGDNNLTSLDVSKCTALTELVCDNNNLTSLDLSECTTLIDLDCGYNNLNFIDVSKCTGLKKLYCNDNDFSESVLNKIYGDLPRLSQSPDIGAITANNNPGYEASDKQIAMDKGWVFWGH